MRVMGLTHCDSGRLLVERWGLTQDLVEVISFQYFPTDTSDHRDLVGLVALSDLLCRMGDIGHGYCEMRQVNVLDEPAFAVLLGACPSLQSFDWARFTFELEGISTKCAAWCGSCTAHPDLRPGKVRETGHGRSPQAKTAHQAHNRPLLRVLCG